MKKIILILTCLISINVFLGCAGRTIDKRSPCACENCYYDFKIIK